MKIKICLCILVAAFVTLPNVQANTRAEVRRVQSEVEALRQQVSEFNESYIERLNLLYSLTNQLNDQVAKLNNSLSRLDVVVSNRTEDARSQDRSLLAEIRELHDKLDDNSIIISMLTQQLSDYRLQTAMRGDAGAAHGLSQEVMFNQAMVDYMQGDFDMAIEGFMTYVETFPGGEGAARAWLHMGDSHESMNRLRQAVEAFTRVINNYPQAAVVPTALYKRGQIEVALRERDNAIADFRDILDRFPTAPEAALARAELQQLLESAQKPKTTAKQPAKATTTPAKKR